MQELHHEHAKLESDPDKLGVLFKEMIQMCLWLVDRFCIKSEANIVEGEMQQYGTSIHPIITKNLRAGSVSSNTFVVCRYRAPPDRRKGCPKRSSRIHSAGRPRKGVESPQVGAVRESRFRARQW
jgi:hypothetical protein